MPNDGYNEDQFRSVVEIWRRNRCLKQSSIKIYQNWIRRFEIYCELNTLDIVDQLTLSGAEKFSNWYTKTHSVTYATAKNGSRTALHSLSSALRILGKQVPPWTPVTSSPTTTSSLVNEFSEHLRIERGDPENTIRKKVRHIIRFKEFVNERNRRLHQPRLMDFDAYVISLREEYARRTVSDICCSLRSFCKFLYETKRSSVDLSTSIFSPKIHRFENPRRIISWNDVQRILEAVDRKSPGGKRDYAILLMMATYGMGAGEIIHLTLEDVNWKETTLHVKRPKTGVQFCLPLLPAIATALADYLQHGRPEFTQSRNIFLTMKSPHRKLACAVTIRHILHSHAQKAGLCTEHLGTHVLRHTQACRQMELGFQPKVIGDILGHRNPESTSAYLRVSIELLRTLSLPVPTHE